MLEELIRRIPAVFLQCEKTVAPTDERFRMACGLPLDASAQYRTSRRIAGMMRKDRDMPIADYASLINEILKKYTAQRARN